MSKGFGIIIAPKTRIGRCDGESASCSGSSASVKRGGLTKAGNTAGHVDQTLLRRSGNLLAAAEPELVARKPTAFLPNKPSVAVLPFANSEPMVCMTLRWRGVDSNFQFRAR